ncbi:MAG: site-specific integrase [Nitrospirae bacterium]|nr:site-specific integrase [Nitrospirota bacterium]
MKVSKRKDRDVWVVDYRDATGKRKRVVGGTTREEAELISAQLTIQVAAKMKQADTPIHPDHDITLKAYAERWLKTVKPHLAQRTHTSYTHLFACYIWPTLGAMILREVRPLHVMQLLEAHRLTKGKNTIRLIKAALSTMFRKAVRHELMAVNPALGRFEELGKSKRSPEVHSMSREQVAQFKQTMDTMRQDGRLDLRWVMLFTTMAGTGLRPSEALALRPGDLDLSRKRLRVERALDADGSVKPTKTEETREVDLSDPLTASLKEYGTWLTVEAMAHGRAPLWLFPDDAGHVLTAEKIRYVFSANVPLLYVAKMLGHSKATTTLKYYARWMPDEDRRYVNMLEPTLEKSWHQNLAPKIEVVETQEEKVDFTLMRNQNATLRSRSATALM